MKLIDSYLLRNLTVATVFVTAGLSSTIWMTQSLRLIQLVVEGGAPFSMFLHLALLALPTFLSLVLPWGLLTAVLFTYNRLSLDSELVVMRATGLGPFALARSALILTAGVFLICLSLTLFLAPAAQRELVRLKEEIRTEYSSVLLREGMFNDVSDGLTVYVRQRGAEGALNGLIIHDARRSDRPITIVANRGTLVVAEAGPRVIVYNGVRQEYDRKTGRASSLEFGRYTLDIQTLHPDEGRWPDPRERVLSDLMFGTTNPLDIEYHTRLVAELHSRFATPLLAPAFTLLALACLLSGEFSRRGQAKRIATAMVGALLLQSLMLSLSSMAVKKPALNGVLYLVGLLPMIGLAWYIKNWRRVQHMVRAARAARAIA